MSQPFTVRRATVDDLETLVALRLMLEYEGHSAEERPPEELTRALNAYLAEALPSEQMLIWVAEARGKIVATSGLIFFQKPPTEHNPSGREAYILNMYTLPEWRGQGIATALVQTLLAYVRQTQARRIFMYATPAGKPLYEKLGFAPRVRTNTEMDLWL
ncbi:MAG TPA: GNAT family N-acetyltransferase [Ktedonobacterales bacterium]|nr:GNAT family N-acetyltransferase [Ktedonobacterales bacterium]